MANDPQDPFAPDINIPRIQSSDEPSPFQFPEIEDGLEPPAPPRRFPWLAVVGGLGGVVLLIVMAIGVLTILRGRAGAISLKPDLRDRPEAVVEDFYLALDQLDSGSSDLAKIRQYFDPDIAWIDNTGALLEKLWPAAGRLLPPEIWMVVSSAIGSTRLKLDFENLEIKAAEPGAAGTTQARVKASSNLLIKDANGKLLWKQHLEITHDLVRKYGRWYLTFASSEKARP